LLRTKSHIKASAAGELVITLKEAESQAHSIDRLFAELAEAQLGQELLTAD
jgi:hypothetical protein